MRLGLKSRLLLELYRSVSEETARKHELRQLFWECTLKCNMRCRHCGSDCKVSSAVPDMPFEDFRKVLERVAEVYDPHRIMVVVTGGEPLMRPDLEKCGREIYNLGFPWGLVSNGRLMSRKRFDALLAAGLHSATISLDGFQEEHDWMRGVAGGFNYADDAVRMFVGEPSVVFDVVTCVNRRNFPKLREFRDYLISLGLKRWRLFTVFPVGRAANDPELQISDEQFRQLMDFIVETRKEGRIRASYACEGFLGPYEGKVRDGLYACHAGVSVASVLADGSISACASIRSDYHQGNIYQDDFVDVWENRFQPYRNRSWMRKDQCGKCEFFKYCLGGGMHLRTDDGKLLFCHMDRLK